MEGMIVTDNGTDDRQHSGRDDRQDNGSDDRHG